MFDNVYDFNFFKPVFVNPLVLVLSFNPAVVILSDTVIDFSVDVNIPLVWTKLKKRCSTI